MDDRQPLAAQTYHILLALGGETMHGYGIIQAFEELTDGAQTLLPGSLYAALSRMVEDGLVEEARAPRGSSSGGPARRYYRMTSRGRAAARSESARRARRLERARARGLAPAEQGR
jgi:DNA-binding PadR family transcriptional regulator